VVLRLLLPFLLLGSIFTVAGSPLTPCGSATLNVYEANSAFPTGGCAIGILDYYNFSYHAVSNAPSDTAILITPSGQGFSFTRADNQPFTASAGQVVQFEIDYNILIDPAPVLGGGDLSLDPPSGNVIVTQFFCNDSVYVFTGTCFGSTVDTLTVGTVPPLPLSASITFPDPATRFQEVGIRFTLDGTNGPSSFDGLDATTNVLGIVPEPRTTLVMSLLLIAGGYKLRKQRARRL
jgi:hypothetical protein